MIFRRVIVAWSVLVFGFQTELEAKTDVWKNLALAGEKVSALATAPANPGTIYAGTASGTLFKIADGSQTRLAQDLGGRSNPITALAVDARNSNVVYVGTTDGIFKSTDAGTTWMVLSWNIAGSVSLVVDPQNSSVLYVAADALGLFKTIDGGTNWIRISIGSSVQSVVIDPRTPFVVYAGTSIGVLKTIDGGDSWLAYPWTAGMVRSLAIDPATPAIVYAATTAGVFKSTNGGMSWNPSGLDSTPVYGLVVDIQESETVYAATANGPFKSVDGARNWFSISEGLSAGVAAMAGDLALCKVYVGAGNGVYETDIGPVLTLHSDLCVGNAWSLVVSHAGGNAPIRLLGTSDGVSWEIPNWSVTNGAGMFTAFGVFPSYTAGNHQLRVEVGDTLSNPISFTVTNCR